MLENYIPIDYRTWNTNGKGENIVSSLSSIEKNIWDAARVYQDSRNGETGHGEIVTYFTLKLLDFFPNAKREIALISAICHDIGWSQLTEVERKLFYEETDDGFGKEIYKRYESVLRARHHEQGIKVCDKLLNNLKYSDKDSKKHILEIISQHDTREGFYSLEDGIMRDADKLWRFTLPHWEMAIRERKLSKGVFYQSLLDYFSQENFFYSNISKDVANIELDNTLKNL